MTITSSLNFKNKHVVVCGGSDGIGYATARAFYDLGAEVTVTGTRDAADYQNDFSGMQYRSLKVQNAQEVESFAAGFSQLDVLVNCIGTVLYGQQEFERDGFEQILDINLTGAMQLCTAFHPLLSASNGNIVMLDSVAAIRPAVNNPAYSASKAALTQLAKLLAMKWGRDGIRVNTVAPGLVPTKLTANQCGPEQEQHFAKRNPVGRFGTPDDIAGAVVYLASPMASYITGHQLVVDGGLSL